MPQQKLKLKRKESQLTKQLIVLIMIAGFATCVVDPPESGGNVCQTGKYFDQQQRTCLSCSSQCLTCIGTSENCLSYPLTSCPKGKFRNSISQICQNCKKGCEKCSGRDNCELCETSHTLINGTCYLKCQKNEYLENKKTCRKCPKSCKTCLNLHQCTSCNPNFSLKNGICIKEKKPKKFLKRIMEDTQCPENCSTCDENNICTRCQTSFTRIEPNSCQALCNINEYRKTTSTSSDCTFCPINCYECTSDEICSSCTSGFKLSSTGICLDECPQNYFRDPLTNNCETCQSGCKECKCKTCCSECKPGFDSLEGECYTPCSAAQYRDTAELNYACRNCPLRCTKCKNGNECTECESGYGIGSNLLCLTICPSGEFRNAESGECQDCKNGCLSCYSEDICLTCQPGYEMIDTSCYVACPEKKYRADKTLNYLCLSCPENCASCQDKGSCLTCDEGFSLASNSKCLAECEIEEYRNSDLNQCESCPIGCSSCSSSTKCLACKITFTMIDDLCSKACLSHQWRNTDLNNICVDCPDNCQTCENDQKFSSCAEGYELGINRMCLQSCPPGKFRNLKTGDCTFCPTGCSTCFSSDICLSCDSDYELFSALCMSKCNPNQYRDPKSDYDCKNCPLNCSTCFSSNWCTSCDSTDYFISSNKLCVQSCEDGEYRDLDDNQCKPCQTGCSICSSSDVCSTCSSNYEKIESLCYPECSDNQYRKDENSFYICAACPNFCTKCNDENTCTECSDNYEIVRNHQNQNLCHKTCLETEFRDENNFSCKACPTGCGSCFSLTFCETCLENYEKIDDICYPKCESNQYRGGKSQNFQCFDCQLNCGSCSSSRCYECIEGFEIASNQCLAICQESEYRDNLDLICKPCDTGCKKCSSKEVCNECQDDYTGIGTSCIKCETNQYVAFNQNGIDYSCKYCPGTCLTCASGTECKTCITGYEIFEKLCYEPCPGKQIRNTETKICEDCPSTCSTCTKVDECTECKLSFELVPVLGGICYPGCEDGQFRDDQGVCGNCPEFCTSCKNLNECLTCTTGYSLASNNKCLTECNEGEYRDAVADECRPCNTKCKTCSSYNFCLTCNGDDLLIEKMCYPLCAEKQFRGDSTQNYQCFDCPANCKGCDTETICTLCDENFNLVDFNEKILCYEKCDSNEFRDFQETTLPCTQCPDLCLECENTENCSSCKDGSVLLGVGEKRSCFKECISTEYRSTEDLQCKPCPSGCKTCDSNKKCTDCEEGKELIEDKNKIFELCYDTCESNFWRDEDTEGYPCKACMEGCLRCSQGDQCLECNTAGGFNINGRRKCLKECGPAQWRFEQEVECRDCAVGCTECVSLTNCASCDSGFVLKDGLCECLKENSVYLKDNQCTECHKSCKTCLDGDTCDSCQVGEEIQINAICATQLPNFEGTDCPEGTYDNQNGFCVQCDLVCKGCFGPGPKRCKTDMCFSTGYVTLLGECVCPSGTYAEIEEGFCNKKCHPSCGFCTGPDDSDCLTCSQNGAVPGPDGLCVSCAYESEKYPDQCEGRTKEMEKASVSFDFKLKIPESEDELKPRIPAFVRESYSVYLSLDGIEDLKEQLMNSVVIRDLFKYEFTGMTEEEFKVYGNYLEEYKLIEIRVEGDNDIDSVFKVTTKDFSAFVRTQLKDETWDGKVRVLQENGGDGVILKFVTLDYKISIRKVPSEGQLSFARNLGVVLKWLILFVLFIGMFYALFLSIQKLKREVAHLFFRYLVTVKFFSKLALINLNFGTILSTFFDQLFWLDFITMWKIFPEVEFRGTLGGKLDEFLIPVKILNSALLATVLYLLSFLLSLILRKSKSVRKIHFLIMGFSAVDVLFYGGIEITKHNPLKSGNTTASKASYIVALITTCCMIFDLVMMTVEGLGPYKGIGKKMKRGLITSFHLRKITKINYACFIRVFFSVIITIVSQTFISFLPWAALVFFNILYLFFNNYKQKLISITEILNCLLLAAIVVFAWDTKEGTFKGQTAEIIQISALVIISLILVFEFWIFFFKIYKASNPDKLDSEIGMGIGMKKRKKKKKSFKEADDDEDAPSVINIKLGDYQRKDSESIIDIKIGLPPKNKSDDEKEGVEAEKEETGSERKLDTPSFKMLKKGKKIQFEPQSLKSSKKKPEKWVVQWSTSKKMGSTRNKLGSKGEIRKLLKSRGDEGPPDPVDEQILNRNNSDPKNGNGSTKSKGKESE